MVVPETAVPFDRTVEIAVAERGVLAEAETVARPVTVGVKRMTGIDLVADADIRILERG